MQSLRRDGVNLLYEKTAGGDPPILFVHGWCCDHSYFAPQFERYAERGHRVVAVDLQGHGQSDKPEGSYAMQGLHDYDPDTVGSPEVPGVYVAADEAQPRSDMSRFYEMFPDILYGKTVGSGHFCQLEVPEQINAMIDRLLTLMLPR
jgi:pimeloyl-ACP methyl ester carboxylesterase